MKWSAAHRFSMLLVPSMALGGEPSPSGTTGFVPPAGPVVVRWRDSSEVPPGPQAFILRDYSGRQVGSGEARRIAPGLRETQLSLSRGFHEIEVPATKRRIGLVAQSAWDGPPDPFFAIDGALSWLAKDDETRAALVEAARWCGIAMIRERLTWGGVHPGRDRWDWDGPQRYDAIRGCEHRQGLSILEVAHDSPAWLGHVGKYPDDLVGAADSWSAIARHWKSVWGAVEVWNEPDIFFGGNLPADQYAAVAKAIAHGIREGAPDVPVVGGVMAHANMGFLATAARNRLLQHVDVFSFHTYGPALEMEDLVARYRQWLRANERGNTPLWITECGRPWLKGPDRPPFEQDALSALDITMKAVEARACGIERYFAFVLPYYEEGVNNFGMADRRGSPLRSLAAYAQAIRLLGRTRYLGDLSHEDQTLVRARIFGDGERTIGVLYTGKIDPTSTVRLGLPVSGIEGIDGRSFEPAADGAIPIPDGLAYVRLDHDRLGDRLVRDSVASRLHAGPAPKPEPAGQIVLRYQFDPSRARPSSRGYRLIDSGPLPLVIRAFNVSSEPLAGVSLRIKGVAASPAQSLDLPARGFADATWTLGPATSSDRDDRLTIEVDASLRNRPLDHIELVLEGEPSLERALSRSSRQVRLPVADRERWTPNVPLGSELTMESSPEAAWRMKVHFAGSADRWVYPYFRLPAETDLSHASGLVIRARCAKPAAVRIFLWEGDTGVGYINSDSLIADDGRWHVARLSFRDLTVSPANAADPNHQLDLNTVRKISVGMNSIHEGNTLEVSDLYLITEP